MATPLPDALRTRFSQLIGEGMKARQAARQLKISPATGVRWAQSIRAHGEARALRAGRPVGSGKLAPHVNFIEELIAQDPDITLYELRDALGFAHGVKVQHTAIWRLLRRLGFTYKKIVGRVRTPTPSCHETSARMVDQASTSGTPM